MSHARQRKRTSNKFNSEETVERNPFFSIEALYCNYQRVCVAHILFIYLFSTNL